MKKLIYLVLVLIFIFSCSKQTENNTLSKDIENFDFSPENNVVPDSLKYIEDYLVDHLEFDKNDIAFANNEFILDNDMVVNLEDLKRRIKLSKVYGTNPTGHRETGEVEIIEPCSGRNCVPSSAKNIYNIAVSISSNVPS